MDSTRAYRTTIDLDMSTSGLRLMFIYCHGSRVALPNCLRSYNHVRPPACDIPCPLSRTFPYKSFPVDSTLVLFTSYRVM